MDVKLIKSTLNQYGARPQKWLGQNFLINKAVLDKVVQAADIKKDDTVLEIGPGLGVLTKELAEKAKTVVAVEKDKRMYEILKETLKGYKNIEIINADILKIDDLKLNTHKLVANLPYYITSPVIRKFLESDKQPEIMILMVQKEVGQRICARPPDMNLLAASVQFYAKPEIVSYVSKDSFWPKPKVDSAIIKITPNKSSDSKLFFKIVKAGFSQPRKQLANNLSKGLKLNKERIIDWLSSNKIKPSQRAESLTIQDWLSLCKTLEVN